MKLGDRAASVRPGGGAAPDVLKIGNRYLCIYGATGGGLGGGHNGRILTMWNKTLNPLSPDFKWSTPVEVCASDGMEDQDAIDPSLLLDPTTHCCLIPPQAGFGLAMVLISVLSGS